MAALGANVLNMALLPAGIVAVVKRVGGPALAGASLSPPTVLGMAGGLAVVLAALLIVAETAAFRPASELTLLAGFAARMVGYHLWIGAVEAVATAAVVSIAGAVVFRKPAFSRVALGLAAVVVLAAIVLPISSSLPDGYEAAAEASGMAWLLTP